MWLRGWLFLHLIIELHYWITVVIKTYMNICYIYNVKLLLWVQSHTIISLLYWPCQNWVTGSAKSAQNCLVAPGNQWIQMVDCWMKNFVSCNLFFDCYCLNPIYKTTKYSEISGHMKMKYTEYVCHIMQYMLFASYLLCNIWFYVLSVDSFPFQYM